MKRDLIHHISYVNPLGMFTSAGQPTPLGIKILMLLQAQIRAVLNGHEDNTGATCHIDLGVSCGPDSEPGGGHPHCYVCNAVGAAMHAADRELELDDEEMMDMWKRCGGS